MITKLLAGYTFDEVKEKLSKLNPYDKVLKIIRTQLDFVFLDRNEDGYVICDGDLILDKKNIQSLPNKLIINGDLWCNFNEKLFELPNDLRVNGNLDCYDCSIIKIGDNTHIGGRFNCSFNIIEKLPNNLVVMGDFICNENLLSDIPSDIYIGGDLKCSGNGKIYISKNAQIIGKITCDDFKYV